MKTKTTIFIRPASIDYKWMVQFSLFLIALLAIAFWLSHYCIGRIAIALFFYKLIK